MRLADEWHDCLNAYRPYCVWWQLWQWTEVWI